MNINATIDPFEKSQKDLESKINSLKKVFSEEEQLWNEYEKLGTTFFLDDRAINILADSLQQVNNQDRLLII